MAAMRVRLSGDSTARVSSRVACGSLCRAREKERQNFSADSICPTGVEETRHSESSSELAQTEVESSKTNSVARGLMGPFLPEPHRPGSWSVPDSPLFRVSQHAPRQRVS